MTLQQLKEEGAPPEMRAPRWEEGQGLYVPVSETYFDWYYRDGPGKPDGPDRSRRTSGSKEDTR